MDVVATISGEESNSYVTVAEADAYFGARLHAGAWETATTGDKEKALVTACRAIEACRLRVDRRGASEISPAVLTQALSFPRVRDTDSSGAYIVPSPVQDAQCEEALALLAFGAEQDRRATLQAAGVTSFSVDGLSETYGAAGSRSPLVSSRARALLAPYVDRGGVIATSDSPAGEFTAGSAR